MVDKAEVLVDDSLNATAADQFRALKHFLVILLFELLFGIGIDVYAEKFTASRFTRLGVTYSRIKVKIKGELSVLDRTLSDCYFGAKVCHIVLCL